MGGCQGGEPSGDVRAIDHRGLLTRHHREGRKDKYGGCHAPRRMEFHLNTHPSYRPSATAMTCERVRRYNTPPAIAGLAMQVSPIAFFASTSKRGPAFTT